MIKIGVNFEKFGYLLETKERFFVRRELRTFAVQLAKYQSSNNKQVAKKKLKRTKKKEITKIKMSSRGATRRYSRSRSRSPRYTRRYSRSR